MEAEARKAKLEDEGAPSLNLADRSKELGLLADISRADVLVLALATPRRLKVVAHERPHSVSPTFPESLVGREYGPEEAPVAFKALARGSSARGFRKLGEERTPVVEEVQAIVRGGRGVGGLSVATNLLEYERHRRRRRPFQQAVKVLRGMVLEGRLSGAEELSPFGEHDGLLVVDRDAVIRYASGIAANLYRRLGYTGDLVGRRLSNLRTGDVGLLREALNQRRCLREERLEGERIWVRQAIPLLAPSGRRFFWRAPSGESRPAGVLLTIHDATEERAAQKELRVQTALMQEIHHRVKNNLQTIAALLRLQARRAESAEAKRVLQESVVRVLSIAVVHEFLSRHETHLVDIKEIFWEVFRQVIQGMVGPQKDISLSLEGASVLLATQQATACALVVNELVQNAVEHAYPLDGKGSVVVRVREEGDQVAIEVEDDGGGLPEGFDLGSESSLGLRIVHTLVEEDLKGEFSLEGLASGGALARVVFRRG